VNAAEALEVVCSDAWPPLSQKFLGQWRLRWAGGFTGRANSALAVGEPGGDLSDTLRAVCDFAHSHAIPPKIQVVQDTATEAAIAAAGWVPDIAHPAGHDVVVLIADARPGAPGDARMLPGPTPAWWELTVGSTEPTDAERHVLTGGKIGYGVVDVDGVTAGVVRGAVVDDVLHIARLAVRPGYRRQGLAVRLLDAAAAWAAELGATRTVLQVSVTNAPALALYGSLGFAEHHRYRYWVPPVASCEDRTS
jgi:ribosomal protein S18 acetylase RimI-like enzyme